MIKVNTKLRTEIICIIDESGSMNSIKDDAIGGFNSFLAEQKEINDDTKITLTLFSSKFNNLYTELPIQEAVELSNENYKPRYQTALYDTLAHCIKDAEERHIESNPDRTLVVILTDGKENASREWNKSGISKLVSEMEAKDWEFIYLGANQDAMVEGSKMGFASGNTLSIDKTRMKRAWSAITDTVTTYRSSNFKKSKTLINKDIYKDYGKEE